MTARTPDLMFKAFRALDLLLAAVVLVAIS
jgi:hypothetical protein